MPWELVCVCVGVGVQCVWVGGWCAVYAGHRWRVVLPTYAQRTSHPVLPFFLSSDCSFSCCPPPPPLDPSLFADTLRNIDAVACTFNRDKTYCLGHLDKHHTFTKIHFFGDKTYVTLQYKYICAAVRIWEKNVDMLTRAASTL